MVLCYFVKNRFEFTSRGILEMVTIAKIRGAEGCVIVFARRTYDMNGLFRRMGKTHESFAKEIHNHCIAPPRVRVT